VVVKTGTALYGREERASNANDRRANAACEKYSKAEVIVLSGKQRKRPAFLRGELTGSENNSRGPPKIGCEAGEHEGDYPCGKRILQADRSNEKNLH